MSSGSSLNDFLREESPEPKSRCVVRIKTSMWFDRSGIHYKKDITYLRRKCEGTNFLEDDVCGVGADNIIERCHELFKLKDGIYEVYIINELRDYWTGTIEDYDYAFKPYVE